MHTDHTNRHNIINYQKQSPSTAAVAAAATVLVALRFYDEELWHMQSQNTTL